MELTINILAGLAVTILGWFISRLVRDFDETKIALKAHVKECNEIPKSTVMEKLESLCEKQDTYQEINTKSFESIDKSLEKTDQKVELIRERLHTHASQIQRLITINELRNK